MKSLKSLLKVHTKTPDTLLLEVKPGSQIDLIAHGFNGDEKLFRLMKTYTERYAPPTKHYTAFFGEELKAGATCNWGFGGETCISESFRNMRDQIAMVAKEFGFDLDN